MQGVEFKAELRDPELARLILRYSGAIFVGAMETSEAYTRMPDGVLKKRSCADDPTEWVLYTRTPRIPPKLSHFVVLNEDQVREHFGERDVPVWVDSRKRREVYLLGPLHVHLDEVQGLGKFVKLEGLVTPKDTLPKVYKRISKARELLGPALGEPVSHGYADMLDKDLGPPAGKQAGNDQPNV